MAKRRTENARRFRQIRGNASIASALETIARMGLPRECIRLVLPSGRKARSDSTVGRLRSSYQGT